MSVINKMLRDLDHRQAGAAAAGLAASRSPGATGLAAGTLVVEAAAAPRVAGRSGLRIWWVSLLLALILLLTWAGLARWWTGLEADGPPAVIPVATGSAAAANPVSSANSPEPPRTQFAVASRPAAAVAAPQAHAPASADRPTAAAVPASSKVQSPSPVVALKKVSQPAVNKLAASQPAAAKASPLPAPAMPPAAELAQTRRVATVEILARAQEQWNLGERPQAIGLLQAAIARLELAPAVDSSAMAALVRETVRMSLVQGQAATAWNLLLRLELPLAGVADIWALRGNVAQRLGKHPEAVQAYLRALELNPDEPRWMLGAAVSLATQGQLGPAGDLAEKARLFVPPRPDVANYLRQLGVAVGPD